MKRMILIVVLLLLVLLSGCNYPSDIKSSDGIITEVRIQAGNKILAKVQFKLVTIGAPYVSEQWYQLPDSFKVGQVVNLK